MCDCRIGSSNLFFSFLKLILTAKLELLVLCPVMLGQYIQFLLSVLMMTPESLLEDLMVSARFVNQVCREWFDYHEVFYEVLMS